MSTTTDNTTELPALPEPEYFAIGPGGDDLTGYTAKHMREYAAAALRHERELHDTTLYELNRQASMHKEELARVLKAGAALACAAHNLAKTGECHLQADAAAAFGRFAAEWDAVVYHGAAATAAQPAIPPGWKLVPITLTLDMRRAGREAVKDTKTINVKIGAGMDAVQYDRRADHADKAIAAWEAILAAAPEAPAAAALAAATAAQPAQTGGFDLIAHLHRQRAFSQRTFGPGDRLLGITDHIAKELREVRESGGCITEWVDVILLALDGAWRSGATPEQIAAAIEAKQTKNEGRTWPDWRTADPTKAIEHDRSHDAPAAGATGASHAE